MPENQCEESGSNMLFL